jgi:methanethiol S-methyltransferase
MKKTLAVVYSVVCYLLFTGVFFYGIGFVANIGVPKSIDTGIIVPGWQAVLVDSGLLGLFALQHSLMARRSYKKWESQFIPTHLQRSTYVLLASLIMLLLFWKWRPLPAVIWNIDFQLIRWLIRVSYALGWGVVFAAPFMLGHSQLYGLLQAWLYRKGQELPASRFQLVGFYKYIRHPIQLGFLLAFWSTLHMTVGHMLFALASSMYIFLGTQLEERDLIHEFGEIYQQYQERVPRLLPFLKINFNPQKTGQSQIRVEETKQE